MFSFLLFLSPNILYVPQLLLSWWSVKPWLMADRLVQYCVHTICRVEKPDVCCVDVSHAETEPLLPSPWCSWPLTPQQWTTHAVPLGISRGHVIRLCFLFPAHNRSHLTACNSLCVPLHKHVSLAVYTDNSLKTIHTQRDSGIVEDAFLWYGCFSRTVKHIEWKWMQKW